MWFFGKKQTAQGRVKRRGVNVKTRLYESANSRLIKDLFTGGDIDQIIESNYMALVRRVREAYANNDYIKSFVSQACTNVIGHKGIRLQSKTDSASLNSKVEQQFKQWSKRGKCDVSGQLSFIDIQLMVLRSLLRDGEFFILTHVINGKLQLQVIDPVRIDVNKRATFSDGRSIINGVEINQYGKPLAYYFTEDDNQSTRIVASKIIHGFIMEYAGQKRGISSVATALLRLGLLKEFETAAVDNARTNAKSLGFFERSGEDGTDYSKYVDREDDEDDGQTFDMKTVDDAARFHVIEEGYKFQGFDSQFPNSNYAPFKESVLKAVSGSLGYGINYINLGNDLKGVSYSSARQGLLSERDGWRMLQRLMIESLVEPIFEQWGEVEYLAGSFGNISQTRFTSILEKTSYQPRAWAWIDPLKDAKGTSESITNKTISVSQAITDSGGDPEEVFNQIAEDNKLMEQLGIKTGSQENESEIENAELLKDD